MKRLKELRQERNLSQEEVAQSLCISQRVLSNYERGTREPSLEMLTLLANFYDVTVDYLLGKSNIRKAEEEADDVSYALLRKAQELTDEEKQQLLDMADFLRSRHK